MLNEKQQKVVDELEKNILLLASAGTGKTKTLSERVAKIISLEKAKPEEILCITFTNKACKEMKERLTSIVGMGANKICIKTFHSFCFDIIRREAKKSTDMPYDFGIIDEEDVMAIIKENFSSDFSPYDILNIIDAIRMCRMNNEIFTGNKKADYTKALEIFLNDENKLYPFLDRHRGDRVIFEDAIRKHGVDLILKYREELRRYNKLDFSDAMEVVYDIFINNPEVPDLLAKQFKFICVDEVQDTSILEYSIISKIFKYSNVLLCGDQMQTIYGWRGSNPNIIFSEFKKEYNPIQIVLDCNYRATKMLTENSCSYLEKAFPEDMASLYEDGIRTNSEVEGEKIQVYAAPNIKAEAKRIYDSILQLSEEERKSTCILTRNNGYNVELSNELRNMGYGGLDFALIDDCRFFRKPEIKDIIAFLKLAVNRNDGDSFKRILSRVRYGIGDATISLIESSEFKEYGVSITDFIDKDAILNNDKFALLVDSLNNNNVVVFDVESTGTDTTRDEIIQIAAIKIDNEGKELSRFMRFLKTDKPVGTSELVHGFSDEFLNENGEDKDLVLTEFLDFIKDTVIVGHNVLYDMSILSSELERRKLPKPTNKTFFDTLDLYRRFYPEVENHKLETLSNLFDTEHKPNHNALFDILATGELLVHVVKNKVIPTTLGRIGVMSKVSKKFEKVSNDMNTFFDSIEGKRPKDIIAMAVNGFNLKDAYINGSPIKIYNMREFYYIAGIYDDLTLSDRDSLIDFVNITSLSNGDMERLLLSKGRIPILTCHQVKGLEFDYVFAAGIQEGIFPSYQAIKSNSLDEEKRLFYVLITRAKKRLHISYSKIKGNRRYDESSLMEYLDNKYLIRY